jgi:type II secretory pathway pseudopilin PulG
MPRVLADGRVAERGATARIAGLPKGVRMRTPDSNPFLFCLVATGTLGIMAERGMTIMELVVGTAILLGGAGAILLGMFATMAHGDYLRDYQIAMNAAEGRLEEMASREFSTLRNGAAFGPSWTPEGQCMGLGEDRNCNDVLDPGEDLNDNGRLDEPLPSGRLNVMIRESPPLAPDPTLLDLHVSACWVSRGRVIGEDRNCNGRLELAVEDANGNRLMDSPVMASTRVGVKAE